MKIGVIGGGAAGFFAAINCKEKNPNYDVVIIEKSDKVLSKVKVSGGGRCNVTNACFSISELIKNYPRGGKSLKKAFNQFYTKDTIDWFDKKGVKLKTESDNRIFPESNSSQTIIDCFLNAINNLDIDLKLKSKVEKIHKTNNGFDVIINNEIISFDKLIITTGGSPKTEGFNWLKELGHNIISPVPSLFTFNIPNNNIVDLMGTVSKNCIVKIEGESLKTEGPVLITHWGLSGPAILKASAWGARLLADKNYKFSVLINWIGIVNEEEIRNLILKTKENHPKKQIGNEKPFDIPFKLWSYLINKAEINENLTYNDLGKKSINKLLQILTNDAFQVSGKTTFKEEFVTCGGIDLNDINIKTMESKVCEGLFFAGEVLDIDGITGGFNFQAAWTTGYIAAKSL